MRRAGTKTQYIENGKIRSIGYKPSTPSGIELEMLCTGCRCNIIAVEHALVAGIDLRKTTP